MLRQTFQQGRPTTGQKLWEARDPWFGTQPSENFPYKCNW